MVLDLNSELKRLERAKQLVGELETLGFNVEVEAATVKAAVAPVAAATPAPAKRSKKGLGEKFRQIQKTYWAEVHRISESEKVSVDKARQLYRDRKATAKA
jgi:hypothetical protein